MNMAFFYLYTQTVYQLLTDVNCRHMKTEHFSLHYHHGPQRHAQASRFDCHDVVLITYKTLVQEWRDKRRQNMIFKHPWHRIILDEGLYI